MGIDFRVRTDGDVIDVRVVAMTMTEREAEMLKWSFGEAVDMMVGDDPGEGPVGVTTSDPSDPDATRAAIRDLMDRGEL